jgi:glycerophosphoryl diester phosphodiesterase
MHPLLDRGQRPIIGHRGNAAHAPENTLESFRQGLAAGAECVELDVHLSGDGVAVVIHDPTLDRTTDATGAVASLSIEQIRRADAGARFTRDGASFPYRGSGLVVPTFEEVLRDLGDVPLLIEIKAPAAAREARRLIEQYDAESRCVVESFEARALEPFQGSGIGGGCEASLAASRDATGRAVTPVLGDVHPALAERDPRADRVARSADGAGRMPRSRLDDQRGRGRTAAMARGRARDRLGRPRPHASGAGRRGLTISPSGSRRP